MAVYLAPIAGVAAQFFDNNGTPLAGGKLYTYAAGTNTPATTYTSNNGVFPHTNPIILDSGRVPNGGEVWLSDNISYKFKLLKANDELVATWDYIDGINSNFITYTIQQDIQFGDGTTTVFNLPFSYVQNTNSLSVYVDGLNQYSEGSAYAYVESGAAEVTFTSAPHNGAVIKFTLAVNNTGNAVSADVVSFTGFKAQEGNVQNLADDDGADWIGFQPDGDDAVARSVQDKLRDTVSVFDFMTADEIYAVQNNSWGTVTDVTVAIQAAFDSFPNQGNPNWQPFVLVFPAGYYKITDTITPQFQQRGEFIGYGAKIIGDFNNPLFQYGETGLGMLWHTLRGFTFEQSNGGANAKAIDMRDVYSCSIVDCFFYGGLTTGYLQGNNNVFMQCTWRGKPSVTSKLMVGGEGGDNQNNTFLNCAFEQVSGFGLCLQSDSGYTGQTYVLSSYFEACDPVALYIKNNQAAVIDGCYFNLQSNTGGIRMDGTSQPMYQDSPVIVRNNNVLGGSVGSSFVLETSSTSPNVIFENNSIQSGSTGVVNFYTNAPNSVNNVGDKRNPFIANATYFTITPPNTYPDYWTRGGTASAITNVSNFAVYGSGAGVAVPANTYIYQQINVPANALIKVTVYAKVSASGATAELQLWSLGLGGQYTAASTTSTTGTTLTVYLNSSARSSAAAFLLLLRNTGSSNTAQFCDVFIEDLTN